VFARDVSLPNGRPLVAVRELAAAGTTGALRGRLFGALNADLTSVVWDREGVYRPRHQTRAELRLSTNLRSRFPSGMFGLQMAVFDEYRARTPFPVGTDPDGDVGVQFAPPSNVLGAHIEIRIMSAAVTYQLRNALNREYQYVPGITMPRLVNYYGVRWEFSN
jgi:hypothetical protein